MKKILSFYLLLYGLTLWAQEAIPIMVSIRSLTDETDAILNEAYNTIDSAMSSEGFSIIKNSKAQTVDQLLEAARESGIPLSVFATIEYDEGNYQLYGFLIHSVDGNVIKQAQSRGSAELGYKRKWNFIAQKFIPPAQEYPLVYPKIRSDIPEKEIEDKTQQNEQISQIENIFESLSRKERSPQIGSDESMNQISSENRERKINLHSIDLATQSLFPLGRFAGYSDFGLGGEAGLKVRFTKIPLNLKAQVGGTYEFSPNPYIDSLVHLSILLEVSYSFALANSYLELTPGLSLGGLMHFVTGNFNTLDNQTFDFYMDQYYGASLELAIYPSSKSGNWGFYITPRFYIFPSIQEAGLQLGASLGVRYRFAREEDM